MLLAVDVGNTNVVFAVMDGRQINARWRIATDARRTGDEYAVWLTPLMALEGIPKDSIDNVIVSTVVPRALHNLEVLSQKYFGKSPWIAGLPQVEYGFRAAVTDPPPLGAGRPGHAVAAQEKYPGDKIIIDFGTATTFDVIDFTGAYKGGIIAPGINLSLDALVGAAAKLPRIAISAPDGDSVVGRTTESQMLIGVFWGYVA